MTARRGTLLALLLAALAAVPVAAQSQHFRQPGGPDQVRAQFLAEVAKGVEESVTRFREAIEARDPTRVAGLFQEGALYSPADGASHYGHAAIREAFGVRLPGRGPLLLTRVDFSASGSLAYQFGRYFYGPGPGGDGAESGTYVLVLYQEGRVWKVRSYVERRSPA